jgi:hypothetical protein
MGNSLVELIPKIARMAAGEKEGPKKYYPRPSSAGPERCTRQMVYHRMGYEEEGGTARGGDDRKFLVFDSSSWHEELVADWIRQSPFTLHSQQMKVDLGITIPGYNNPLGGSIDGILQDLMNVEELWENKAINHFTFESYWEADPGDMDKIPWDNICQSCVYSASLQREQANITGIRLTVKNKNTDNMIEFQMEYLKDCVLIKTCTHMSSEVKELNILVYFPVSYCVDKFVRIEEHALSGTLPDREYEHDHWRCEYCSYRTKCWEKYLAEMEQLSTDAMLADEVETLVTYFQEIKAQIREMEKEKDELKEQVIQVMKEAKAQKGRAGDYVIKYTPSVTQRIDKSLVPSSMLPEITKTYYGARLSISKPKKQKKKKDEPLYTGKDPKFRPKEKKDGKGKLDS